MTNKALIFVDKLTEDGKQVPTSLLKVGGVTVLERQLRGLKRVGISQVYLISNRLQEMLEGEIKKFKLCPESVDILTDLSHGDEHWRAHESLVVLEEGRLIDQRVLEHVMAEEAPKAVALFEGDTLLIGAKHAHEVSLGEGRYLFGSVARVLAEDLTVAAQVKDFVSSPIAGILAFIEGAQGYDVVNISKIKLYDRGLRRELDILWRPLEKESETTKATRALIARAQKGTLDGVARWVHPILENFLVEHLLKTPLQGLLLKVLLGVVGVYLTYLFAIGHMGWALAGALILGVLYGVEGKLLDVSMGAESFRQGSFVFNKLIDYSWMLAMAHYMAEMTGNPALWAVGLMLIGFDGANHFQKAFYKLVTGVHLDDTGKVEQNLRIVAARRNTRTWILIPFAATELWELGFWVIALYTAICFFITQFRFFIRIRERLQS